MRGGGDRGVEKWDPDGAKRDFQIRYRDTALRQVEIEKILPWNMRLEAGANGEQILARMAQMADFIVRGFDRSSVFQNLTRMI